MSIVHVCRAATLAAAIVAAAAVPASPQSAANSAPSPPVIPMQWLQKQPYPNAGKVALYQGETDAIGVAFSIPAGTVFSRCAVVVASLDKSSPITVRLKNELSTKWDRDAMTGADGIAEIKYRTEGGAFVLLQSPGGRQRYQLMILQGKELPVHLSMKPPFVSMEQYRASQAAPTAGQPPSSTAPAAAPAPASSPSAAPESSGGGGVVLWVIAGLLAVLVGLGIVLVLKRRSS